MDISRCGQCDAMFSNRKDLNMHRLTAHIANLVKIPCPQCNVYYEDLEQHMQASHGVQGPVCPYCAFLGKRNWALKLHIEQVHLNIQIHKPAACPICKKIFVKKGHMERHIKMVHEGIREGSRPCKYCGKEMCNPAALEKHEAMVHEGVREECPLCSKVLCDLYKHMRIVHGKYQRKAKLPKDCIDRLDDPNYTFVPKIYGAAPTKKHLASMKPVIGLRSFTSHEERQNVIGSLGKRSLDNQQKRTSFIGSLPITNSSPMAPKSRLNNSPISGISANQNESKFPISTNQGFTNSPISTNQSFMRPPISTNQSFTRPPISTNQSFMRPPISTNQRTTSFQEILAGNMSEIKSDIAPQVKIKDEPIDLENDDFLSVIANIFNTPPLIKLEPEDNETEEFSNFHV